MIEPRGGRWSLPAKITLLAAVTEVAVLIAVVAIARARGATIDRVGVVAIAAVLAVPVVIVYHLTRFVVGRLTVPVVVAYRRLAAGDFAAELPTATGGKDFLGLREGFRAMAGALERTLAEVRRADRERRRLFADLAHELATPTTTLLGIAAALRRGAGDPDRLLELLERESARLERLVTDVRELAALEDPELALATEPCDVGALAVAAVERGRLAHPDATGLRCTAGAVTAGVDPVRIDQVLANLIGNAVRYAGAAAIVVGVAVDGDHLVVRVDDAGPGVADDRLPELGRRLARLDRSRSRDTGGHGLGLAIVRAIAERHGGSVGFGRADLGGLAVAVRLPIAGPDQLARAQQ